MASITLPVISGYRMGTDISAPNTIVVRDSVGGIDVEEISCTSLVLDGILEYKTQTITTSTVLDGTELFVWVDATSGPITVTLPTVSFPVGNTGRVLVIKKIDSTTNQVTIIVGDAALIDGQTTKLLSNQFATAYLICDGSNWFSVYATPVRNVLVPVPLTFASTVSTDSATGNTFSFTATSNFTLANPSHPAEGQKVLWIITQDGTGSRVITLDTQFRIGSDLGSVVLSTTAGKSDYLGAVYRLASNTWNVVTLVRGY